jgi:hypothetical protein
MAIGAGLSGATMGAVGLCIAFPIIGWFIGLPIVLGLALMAVAMWLTGLFLLFAAWALTAMALGAISFGHRFLESRG